MGAWCTRRENPDIPDIVPDIPGRGCPDIIPDSPDLVAKKDFRLFLFNLRFLPSSMDDCFVIKVLGLIQP